MTGSKPAALPLGYTPNEGIIMGEVEVICKGILPYNPWLLKPWAEEVVSEQLQSLCLYAGKRKDDGFTDGIVVFPAHSFQ